MRIEAIPNRGPANMALELERNLDWAEQVDIASAYVTVPALRRLEGALAQAKKDKRSLTIRLLFGLYQRFTPPEALDKMLKLQREYPSKLFVRVARNNRFHWKSYAFRKSNARRLYVGSANFTEDGLNATGELSVKITTTTRDKIVQLLGNEFDDVWREDAFLLDASVLKKYRKVKRPSLVFTSPNKDDAISSLLKSAERPSHKPLLTKTKPCVAFVPDDVTEATKKIIHAETDWEERGWNYICFPRKDWYEHIRDAGVILYVVYGPKPKEYWMQFRRIRKWVELVTPDGKYFVAHSRLRTGWWRQYDKVKSELAQVGLTWKKIISDSNLSKKQIEVLCRLLHVSEEQVLKSKL